MAIQFISGTQMSEGLNFSRIRQEMRFQFKSLSVQDMNHLEVMAMRQPGKVR